MKKRSLIVAGTAALVAGWALFRPELLFIDTTVHEDFPIRTVRPVAHMTMEEPMEMETESVTEAMPQDGATVIVKGDFRAGAHDGKGTATIYKLEDGKRLLRLTGFETSNGPDLRVILVAAPEASDTDAVKKAGYKEIARLKGNKGDQNYEIPADIDLSMHRTVCIWCNRFSVNFTSAPLK